MSRPPARHGIRRLIRPDVRRLFRLGIHDRELIEREIDAEIEEHLRRRTEQLERQGLSSEAARAEALRRFGSVDEARRRLVRAATRRERRLGVRGWLDALSLDLRFAWRSIHKERGFTAVVVLVMALGIGANAAMFGVLDRLLLRGPEHVRDAEHLARLRATVEVPAQGTASVDTFGYVTYALLRDRARSFEGVAAYSASPVSRLVAGSGEGAEEVLAGYATADLFPLLGVKARLGRFFGPEDDRVGAPPVAVLGYGWWQRRFGGDPEVLGKTVELGGDLRTIVGVAPRGFTGVGLGRVDVWQPMALRSAGIVDDWQTSWNAQWLQVVGRLAPGVTRRQAGEDATRIFRAAFEGDEAPFAQARLSADPLIFDDQGEVAPEIAVSRWLAAVSLLVLMIAVANGAGLLLARTIRRRHEIAVRLALGITRGRLVRLIVVESLILAGLAGLAALGLVPAIAALVRTTLLPDVSWTSPPLDARVALVVGALTIGTGLLTGLIPALRSGGRDLTVPLRAGAVTGGRRVPRLRTVLAVAQATLSVVLLVAAGLFVRSFAAARTADLGVEPYRVLVVGASWTRSGQGWSLGPVEDRQRREKRFYADALERARRLPGVDQAAVAVGTPFQMRFQVRLRVQGIPELPRLPGGGPSIQAVSPGYFRTVGLDLLQGRRFEDSDRPDGEHVAIVNQTMAETLWPGADPLGRCLVVGSEDDAPCTRVVGVVENGNRLALKEERAMQYYVPLGQEHGFDGTRLLVRPAGRPEEMIEPLRRALLPVDPTVLWLDVESLGDTLAPEIRPWRLGAVLMGTFGTLALLISSIGLYSLLAHMVAARMREMGIRTALGARRGQVLALVVRYGLGVTGLGLTLGMLLALLAGRAIGPLLFETSPRDPLVYGAVAATLLAVAAFACLTPGQRAARVDPATVLREE